MVPTENTIFLKTDDYKEQLKFIKDKYKKILLVAENRNQKLKLGLDDFRENNIHNNNVSERMIITRHLFFYLVRKGFLKDKNFDVIILTIKSLEPFDVSTFKLFYRTRSCLVYSFLEVIQKNDPIYLFSKIYNSKNIQDDVKLIFCKPKVSQDALSYLKLKKLLNFQDKDNLQEISYNIVLKKILAKIKSDQKIAKLCLDYKNMPIDKNELMKISLDNLRLKTLKNILEKNKDKKIYVVCKRNYLLNALNFINEYTTDIDIIIFYDLIDTKINGKNGIIFVDEFSDLKKVSQISSRIKEFPLVTHFYDFMNRKQEIFCTEAGAFVEKNYSHVMLDRILINIKYIFEEHFLFLSSLIYYDAYVHNNNLFKCFLTLPEISDHPLFRKKYVSQEWPSKKEALMEITMKIIDEMVKESIIDQNLVPVKTFFIFSEYYKNQIYNIYKFNLELFYDFENEFMRNHTRINTMPFEYYLSILENNSENRPKYFTKVYNRIFLIIRNFANITKDFRKHIFKTKYMVDPQKQNFIEMKSRAIPSCFLSKSPKHLYYIKSKDFEIGLLCGKSFQESHFFDETEYSYLGEFLPNRFEEVSIALFNTIFFGINYKKKEVSGNYNYLLVPFKNRKMDFQKFHGNLLENPHLKDNLLFNPFNKTFYVFLDWVAKENYKKLCNDKNDSEILPFFSHFENKFDVKLTNTNLNSENLIFVAQVYSQRGRIMKNKLKDFEKLKNNEIISENDLNSDIQPIETLEKQKTKSIKYPNILPLFISEIVRVTPFPKTLFETFNIFKEKFIYFEVLSLAEQAKIELNLPISTKMLSKCFMSKNEKYPDYERYEFLGDTILKYLITKFVSICFCEDTGPLVDRKCRIIENTHLTNIGRLHSFEKYFSNLDFQPPSLENHYCQSLQKYFKFHKLGHKSSIAINHELGTEKTYADIIEALLGVCYLENGIERTEKLIFDLQIIPLQNLDFNNFLESDEKENGLTENIKILDEENHTSKDKEFQKSKKVKCETFDEKNFIKEYLNNSEKFIGINKSFQQIFEFSGILTENDIESVEEILKYKFKQKGLIEKALVHPSFRMKNIFGTRDYFEKLEFIGDSVLDVFVADGIYTEEKNPYDLHEEKKVLVCNQFYSRIFFDTSLYKYAKTCSIDQFTYRKICADIFEAVNGAVLVDLGYDINAYGKIWEKSIKKWIFTEQNKNNSTSNKN